MSTFKLPFVDHQLTDTILWIVSISVVVSAVLLFHLLFRNKSKNNKYRRITDLANIFSSLNDIDIQSAKKMFQRTAKNGFVTEENISEIISLTLNIMVQKRRLSAVIRDHLQKFWKEEAHFCKQFDDWIILDIAFTFRRKFVRKSKKSENIRFSRYIKALKICSQTYQYKEGEQTKAGANPTTIEFAINV